MKNDHLSNIRWLCLSSENFGQDWFDKSKEIDKNLESLGLDLSNAGVYLLLSDSPKQLMVGNGECLVGRSVIGPKKELNGPLSIVDWKASPVWSQVVQGESLNELYESAESVRRMLIKEGKKLQKSFILCFKRQIDLELRVWTEVFFYE
jgi:hypothetical protein